MPSTLSTDYDSGFEAGLVQGFRAARERDTRYRAFDEQMRRRRIFLAGSTMVLGLGSVVGAILAHKGNRDLFTALTVAGGVVTTIVGAAQILVDESASGPLGIK